VDGPAERRLRGLRERRRHALSDTELSTSGVPFTIVKPHFFMQNLTISAQSVANQLGEVVGKAVKCVPVSVEQTVQGMSAMGLDDWMLGSVRDYFTAYSNGWGDFVTDDFQRVTGRAPRAFSSFAQDFGAAFGK
jgi:hypothetical protein